MIDAKGQQQLKRVEPVKEKKYIMLRHFNIALGNRFN